RGLHPRHLSHREAQGRGRLRRVPHQAPHLREVRRAREDAPMTVERMLPLYQGMMTTFYDHRAADVVKSESAPQRQNQPRYLTDEDKADPARLAIPQYWVRESLLDPELPEWFLVFSNLTSATN